MTTERSEKFFSTLLICTAVLAAKVDAPTMKQDATDEEGNAWAIDVFRRAGKLIDKAASLSVSQGGAP